MPGVSPRRRRGYGRPAGSAPVVRRYLRATTPGGLEQLERGAFDGLVFGAEFCHRRLPRPEVVLATAARCRELGLDFTLVTPVTREAGFEELTTWLRHVATALPGREWVFNDWGLLLWAREHDLELRPSVGRLLSRQRRGPRVGEMIRTATPEEMMALRGSVWDDPRSGSLLEQHGVGRVELDWLPQGVRRPSLPRGVGLSVCGPWIPVTVSPSCSWSADPLHCPITCQAHPTAVLRDQEQGAPLWSRGNAIFARLPAAPAVPLVAALGADRLVWAEDEVPG